MTFEFNDDAFKDFSPTMAQKAREMLSSWCPQKKTNDQQLIIANVQLLTKEEEIRKNNSDEKKSVFGVFRSSQQADIVPGDVLYMFPVQPSDDQVDTCIVDMGIRGKVFAGFDGLLTYGAKTRADYRRLLKRSGIAKGFMFRSIGQPNDGLAAIYAGSTYVRNNSKSDIQPFTKLMDVIPSPDEATRKREMDRYAKNIRYPCNRMLPIIVPVGSMSQREFIRQAVVRLFRGDRGEGDDKKLSLRRLHPSKRSSLNQLDYFSIALKQLLLIQTLNSIAALDYYGLISLNMPEFGAGPSNYNSANSLLSQSLADIIDAKQRPTIAAQPTGGVLITGTVSIDDATRRRTSNKLIWLASQLGVVTDSVDDDDSLYKPNQNLIDATTVITLAPHFKVRDNQKVFDPRRLIDPTISAEDLESFKHNDTDGRYAPSTFPLQWASKTHDAVEVFVESANMLLEARNEGVLGTSLTNTEPGEYTQIVM